MGFLLTNLRLKLLALLFAIGLWSVVAYTENPTRDVVYRLSIDHPNVPTGLVILGTLPQIPVTVTAPSDELRTFDPSSLHLVANFSTVHAGLNTIPLRVDNSDPNVTVRQDYPRVMAVTVDEQTTMVVAVTIVRQHQPPTGFHEASISVTPNKVTVLGPKTELAGVQAQVIVDLAGEDAPYENNATVEVVDAAGKKIEKTSAAPSVVDVKVAIEADNVTETKAVGWALSGQPAPGYRVANVQVTPLMVSATGLAAELAGVSQIPSDPIDISNQTADVVKTVRLRPPAGVQVSAVTVVVHVFISRIPGVSPSPSASP